MSEGSDKDVGELTALLRSRQGADRESLDRAVALVYDELKRLAAKHLAAERPGHTLQTTALVHEAYLRLAGQRHAEWKNRAYFFGAAATMMRRILVDHARRRRRDKRGDGVPALRLDDAPEPMAPRDEAVDIEALDCALTKLCAIDARQARVVELRYFSGMTIDEIAEALSVSPGTVKRDWTVARAWLFAELG